MNWSVYIILCTDNTLYTGISTDVSRRFHQHATQKGAKYFRGRCPKQLLFIEAGFMNDLLFVNHSSAKPLFISENITCLFEFIFSKNCRL